MKFVEFLEMICRVALREHEREVLQGKQTQKKIYDVVYEQLNKLFLAHGVFPLDTRDFLEKQTSPQDVVGDARDIVGKLIQKAKAAASMDPAGGVIQERTVPPDPAVEDEDELVDDYVNKQNAIEQKVLVQEQ